MDENKNPGDATPNPEEPIAAALARVDWQHVIDQALALFERSTAKTGIYTAILMGLVIVTFVSLAAYALALNHVDTAEKLMIALVSFLGGAAVFGGNLKK